jgi:TolA-binding protein
VKKAEMQIIEEMEKYPTSAGRDLARYFKAYIELQNGDYHIAIADLEVFIQERNNSPYIPAAHLLTGYIQLEARNYPEAERAFKQAFDAALIAREVRSDKPNYADIAHNATYWLAISLCHQGRYVEAVPYFSAAYKDTTKMSSVTGKYAAQSVYALGTIAEMDKEYSKAIGYYKLLQEEYPYSNASLASLIRNANDELLLREPQRALLLLQKVESIHQHIEMNDSIGKLYVQQDFIDAYTEDVMYLKGESFNQLGNYDQAIIILNDLVKYYAERNDRNGLLLNDAYMGLGWAELHLTNYNSAIKYYDMVLKSSAEENSTIKSLAYLNKITALKKMGKTDDAQALLSQLSVRPNFPLLANVLLDLGQIYYEKKDYEQARKTLERAEREADNPRIQVRVAMLLGASCIELKQYKKAFDSYKKTEQFAERVTAVQVPNRNWYANESRLYQGVAAVLDQRSNDAITPLLHYIGDSNASHHLDEGVFWLAEAYYRTDMMRNSADMYEKVVANFPTSKRMEEALYGLGWSYFRLEQFANSSKTFDRLVSDYPSSAYATEVLARQGDGYYRIKNYAKASEYYDKAAKQGPETEEGQYAAYQLAHTLYRQAKYEQAITASLRFVKNYPKSNMSQNALYLISWIRFQQEKYPEAIENFNFLIQTYSQSILVPRAYFAIADAYYNMGNYEEAMNGYKFIVEQFPTNDLAPEAMKSIQQSLIALDRDAEAIGIADSYISSNPTSPFIEDFRYKKAEMYYTGKRYPDAISEYSAFAKQYPESEKSAEALYWLGKSYSAMGEVEDAGRTFLQLRMQFPKHDYAAAGMLEYGLLLKQENMIDSAISVFRNIEVEFSTNDAAPQSGFEIALLFFGKGDTLAAVEQFKKVAAKYPGTDFGDQSSYRIGMYYRYKGNNEAALAEFSQLAEVYDNPDLAAECRYRMGEIYLKLDDFVNARLAFEIIRDKFAGYEDWFSLGMLGLGDLDERDGLIDDAREIYSTIHQIRPDDEFGKSAAQRLKRLR